jgi:DNA-binding MarR family transcriptional regulator
MEKRGLVAREACADDARGSMVRLTEKGREAIEAAAPAHADNVRRLVFDPLTPDEIRLFGDVLDRILGAVRRGIR